MTPVWATTTLEVLFSLKLETLKEYIRSSSCIGCARYPRSELAHVRGRGAGGPDTAWNMIPFCTGCHQLQHRRGWGFILDKSARLRRRLPELGWEFDHTTGKLWHPGLGPTENAAAAHEAIVAHAPLNQTG